MLDVMSNGRLVAGMVIGGGPEYYSYQINPTYAREKFREALDLILAAWTRPGPFLWKSKHYFFRQVNPWPTPMQKPHPPIWIPGAGSLETVEFVAQRRFAYMGIPYFHIDVFKRMFGMFRDACAKQGISVGRDFPPFEKTHARISIGTMEEMRRAVDVFRGVLKPVTTAVR